jgi:26S proteasome regulatory subunit N2
LEEMLKKVTTEKAPVAGQQVGGSSTGLTPRQQQNLLSQALRAGGGDLRSLSELNDLVSRAARAAGTTSETGTSGHGLSIPHLPGSGAAAAAGVLTAVDEDDDDEEASVPRDFDYYTEDEEE